MIQRKSLSVEDDIYIYIYIYIYITDVRVIGTEHEISELSLNFHWNSLCSISLFAFIKGMKSLSR